MYDPADDPQLRVIRSLGEGGTATVTLAHHGQLKRQVAVKYGRELQSVSGREFPALARREYELIGEYRFPGLVRPLLVLPPAADHLILELCTGPTLDMIGRIDDPELALRIISAIAADLEFLRAAGLVHGDLKPQNVFLPQSWAAIRPGQMFFAKLSDISLGRRLSEPESARLGLGTVGFMAPETILNHRTGVRSDLFALGVIAYQMLSGRHPFMDEDSEPVKVNSRTCEQHPTPLAELRPEVSGDICKLVERLLAKSETARPESGWEICEELRHRGTEYPYRQLLTPGFLIRRGSVYSDTVANLLDLTNVERAQLDELTDEDPISLRLLLAVNFTRRLLVYNHGRFHFEGDVYWPSRMRRHLLQGFGKANWRDKKTLVLAAISGGDAEASRLGLVHRQPLRPVPRALPTLLLSLLRTRTVARISARLAPLAAKLDAHDTAARLNLQAGNLTEAERCTDLAVHDYMRHDRKAEALTLLLGVDRCARGLGTVGGLCSRRRGARHGDGPAARGHCPGLRGPDGGLFPGP